MAKNDNALGYGANSWLNLPNSLLSAEGKRLVTDDPDLSAQTIEMLRKLEPTEAERFGSYYFSEEGNTSDIGLATLSMCIRDNPSATMAELVPDMQTCEISRLPMLRPSYLTCDTALGLYVMFTTE